jgi:GntR family transcriptional regulator / MocR family aminotransferase
MVSNDSPLQSAVAFPAESQDVDDELGDEGQPLGTFPLAIANIVIDARSPLPLHEQICQAIRTAIWTRELPPSTLLPTTRELARHLGVARNTAVFAYTRLCGEGLCISKRRRGTRVASDLPAQAFYGDIGNETEPSESDLANLRTAFHTRHALQTRVDRTAGGTPFALSASDPVQYPRTKLGRRLADKFLGAPAAGTFAVSNVCDRFQTSVAAYLRQTRGVVCAPSQIIAVSGLEAALDLTARVLIDPGDSVLVEDPSMDIVHSAFLAARAYVRPISIDAFGANPRSAEGPPARILFVSPSVNFPLGTSMSQSRRLEVLEAVRAQNAILFENDTCFELRYSGASLRSIQGQDRDGRVIYYGGFSEILGNSVRMGYLVIPKALLEAFVEIARRTSSMPAFQMQDALADFIEEHEFSVHARNVRSLYATRLEAVKRACRDHLPLFVASEPVGGLHVVLYHKRERDVVPICEAASREGIPVRPLSQYYMEKRAEEGLVFGFGVVPERSILPMMRRLAELSAESGHSEHALAQ